MKRVAHSQQDKAVFILGMIGIKESRGMLIKKDRLGLFKGDAMSFDVLPVLCRIPFKSQFIHMYSVQRVSGEVNAGQE